MSIHDVTGEYVRGEWTPASPPDGTGTQEIELVWNSTVDVHHLAWVEDGFLFEVFTSRWSMTEANNGPCAMTKDDFVAIAQSLK
ncbi:MAG TPA: hypothetical protein VHP83_08015 [Aggregatilineaceae bacterium]|nr:hypothetical protein [Aggregatilineaceae bacterium]